MIDVCASGRKHETLPMGVFEYADSKNRGNHDVIPVFPSQKLETMADRGMLLNSVWFLLVFLYPDYHDLGVFAYVL